jgi:hypothetical protein
MADERQRFLVTDVKLCEEGWNHKWSKTHDVETEGGHYLILELTIDAAKKLRSMPERLPASLGKLGGVWE